MAGEVTQTLLKKAVYYSSWNLRKFILSAIRLYKKQESGLSSLLNNDTCHLFQLF